MKVVSNAIVRIISFIWHIWNILFTSWHNVKKGSRAIAPKENCTSTPKLTLSQTLTLIGVHFSSGAIVLLPANPKTNPDLDPNVNPNRGVIFLDGQWSGYL